MKFVKELRFIEILNKELYKQPSGAGLKPFVLGSEGFEWISEGSSQEEIYRQTLNLVRDRYGIAH